MKSRYRSNYEGHNKMKLLLMVLLLLPQLAWARVYMCVDPATGKSSFTDKACAKSAPGETVRVVTANPGSAARSPKKDPNKVWQSQRDTTRSGRDYNQERRAEQSNKSAAIVASGSD